MSFVLNLESGQYQVPLHPSSLRLRDAINWQKKVIQYKEGNECALMPFYSLGAKEKGKAMKALSEIMPTIIVGSKRSDYLNVKTPSEIFKVYQLINSSQYSFQNSLYKEIMEAPDDTNYMIVWNGYNWKVCKANLSDAIGADLIEGGFFIEKIDAAKNNVWELIPNLLAYVLRKQGESFDPALCEQRVDEMMDIPFEYALAASFFFVRESSMQLKGSLMSLVGSNGAILQKIRKPSPGSAGVLSRLKPHPNRFLPFLRKLR
jgi:hypothetical protein